MLYAKLIPVVFPVPVLERSAEGFCVAFQELVGFLEIDKQRCREVVADVVNGRSLVQGVFV